MAGSSMVNAASRTRGIDQATQKVVDWLLSGDSAIEFHARRDLLHDPRADVAQKRIPAEGWGRAFLAARRSDGHWGRGFYQPKWTSTHYTLLDLARLGLPGDNGPARESVDMVLDAPRGRDGGINYAVSLEVSDVCVNGMILSFAAHFRPEDPRLGEIAGYLLDRRQPDGGWNCDYWRGSVHSSLHSTISTLEGLAAYRPLASLSRRSEIDKAIFSGGEFILAHRLFRSRKTGAVIDPRFLRLTYPSRWRFDILRALDFFKSVGWQYDERMSDALEVLMARRRDDGKWLLAAPHPGAFHFHMEVAGQPSRWNTLRALRVLRFFPKR